uniref:Uncharacterized protein LOC100369913 n=1 Tax=Saccoglossus kowalevskii TaxID=10224 RepID=A0ABM0M6P0_SACKO|nr:PREDICTED: uncharacterized protein LOC100369913 [Saccoglossus kowalevskii]
MKFAILIWVTLAAYVSSQKLNGRSARALVRRTELLAGPCDEDDIIYKNHCYLFVTDKQTHDTAKAMCEEHGYGLASISSEDERQFLKNTIQADSSLSGNVYWVGATRVDGVWTWDSGEEFVDSYWGGGQPISTKLRDCAYIYPQKFKLSNRKRCNKFTARYICERDQGEPPSKLASVSHIGSCEGGEFRHGDHCYTVSTSKRNLDGAYSTCEQMGYYLAGANTVDELNFVRGLGSDDGNNDIWIGGVSMPGYGGFEWLSGGTWLRESWGDTGSPKVKQAEMACSSMRRKKDYYLRKNKCSKKYTYICERSIPYRMRACEGEDLNLQCEEGAINIIEANFGRTAGNNVCPSSNIQNQDCWNEVSLAKVQEFCEGKTQCIVPATTDVFGEPCAGTDKYLDVIYRCGSGKASPERRTPIATDGCKCIAWGDPHYLTCDGLKHDFQGNCTYTTFLDQLHPDPYFEVKAKNSFAENRKNPVSFQEKITVHVKHPLYTRSHTFQFFRNRTVNMDGLPVTPPISPENDLLLDTIGMGVILTTGYGFWMTYDFEHRTEMRAPPEYANMIGGMCGNCDGNRHNDYVMPDGSQASSAYELGNSWKAGTSCPDVVDDLPECDAAIMSWYSQSDQCGMIKDPLGIFADCISALDPALVTEHFDTCMFDMCYLGDDADLCDNIGALYDDCLLNGVEIPTFRTSSFCALECPNNSIYNPSMPPCQNSCVDPTAASACLDPLAEGCECEEGFVRSGLECVPLADCGCFGLDGSYHKKGDTWVSSDCRQFCTCTGDGDSECEEIPCDEHSICVTIGGTRQCECAPGYIGDGETCEQQDSPDTEQCPAVGETTACSSVDGQCKGICGPDETLALNTLLCPEGCYCCHQRTGKSSNNKKNV